MKPFKETKFGKLLFDKLPDAAAVIGDVLPDNGLLGIIKNIIEQSTLSAEEKKELQAKAYEFELTELKSIIEDKANARNREIDIAKAGRNDYLMTATGWTILISFLICELSLIFLPVPEANKELFIHLLGIVEGAFIGGMVSYYYGYSKHAT